MPRAVRYRKFVTRGNEDSRTCASAWCLVRSKSCTSPASQRSWNTPLACIDLIPITLLLSTVVLESSASVDLGVKHFLLRCGGYEFRMWGRHDINRTWVKRKIWTTITSAHYNTSLAHQRPTRAATIRSDAGKILDIFCDS